MRAHLIQLLALVAMASVSWSATIVVRPDYSGDVLTIQDAVNAASSGDEIILGDGVFRNSGNIGVLVRKAVRIRSESGDPSRCIIDCGTVNHAFHFDRIRALSFLEGVTVTRGGDYDIGGAVWVWLSPITIRNCIFRGNIAEAGGAVHGQQCAVRLEGCVIVDNIATRYPGGGIVVADCALSVVECTIVRNGATPDGRGGGIGCGYGSVVTIERSIISGSTFGSAVWCDETSTVEVSCSNVFGNAGGDWVECLAGKDGQDGNFSADPLFCDPDAGVYTLLPESPCADVSGCGLIGALPVQCEVTPPPAITLLGAPHPNPSSGAVRVRFDVSPETVGVYELNVFDLRGRRVYEQLIVAPTAAAYDLSWDGTDRAGRVAGPGVYFLSLRGGGFEAARKLIRVR